MNRYVIVFSKTGYIKYTSHLDMLRLFKRAFKKTGISLAYSMGYNPHPKMGFAQPLSLGYTGLNEVIEFETKEDFNEEEIRERMQSVMPEGMTIKSCIRLKENIKSLASIVEEGIYKVTFPHKDEGYDFENLLPGYLNQPEIIAAKRQKKTKKYVDVNIKDKIREIKVNPEDKCTLDMTLDTGSNSNLSPEQVIASIISYGKIDVRREDIEVERVSMNFGNKFHL